VDSDSDGVDDKITTKTITYDDDGNPLTRTFESDNDADGVIDRSSVYGYTYDASGNLLDKVLEVDRDHDGVVDLSASDTWDYEQICADWLAEPLEDKDGAVAVGI
ncbi:MAG: hypothetical protein PVG41_06300, partial [Desulfobacteraceae bacterium]